MSDNNTMTNIPSSTNQATSSVPSGTPIVAQPVIAQPAVGQCPAQKLPVAGQPNQQMSIQQQQAQAQPANLQNDYAQAKATVDKGQ